MVCVTSGFRREVAEFWVITQNNAKEKVFLGGFLNPEDGTDRSSRNVVIRNYYNSCCCSSQVYGLSSMTEYVM